MSRVLNLLRRERIRREIDEELASHLAEAVERGRDLEEAKRALGSTLRLREQSRDERLAIWLESFLSDIVFGVRQIWKNKAPSLAAVLSLALAIGACATTFRLVDSLLLRPLPVAEPEDLFSVVYRSSMPDWSGAWRDNSYPTFLELRDAAAPDAELIAHSRVQQRELRFPTASSFEPANLQYVSGRFFPILGLEPSLGRLLSPDDDRSAGQHPVAVLSEDYWRARFGADPEALGSTFELGNTSFEVVGVVRGPFTGVEPGRPTDVFVPTMMARDILDPSRSGFRILGRWRGEALGAPTEQQLGTLWKAIEDARWTQIGMVSRDWLDRYLASSRLTVEGASRGASQQQETYGPALLALLCLAAFVLMIACANVANLMFGLAVTRSRELSLRSALGAGRRRLIRLLVTETSALGLCAALLGALFSLAAAPRILERLTTAETPLQLGLPLDGRFVVFCLSLALLVCVLCGLAPALRASSLQIGPALKNGNEALRQRRLSSFLLGAQLAFCTVVILAGGAFATSLVRLSALPTGFDSEGLVNLEVSADPPQPEAIWTEAERQLGETVGVLAASTSGWPLLDGSSSNGRVIAQGGASSDVFVEFYCISSGWLRTLQIPLLEGSPLRPSDRYPGNVIVNESFAQLFYDGASVVGRTVQRVGENDRRTDLQVVGRIPDVKQNELRDEALPVIYVPCAATSAEGDDADRRWANFVLRTDPSVPDTLERAVALANAFPGLRVRRTRTQESIIAQDTLRERLLASLGLFFSGVALLLTSLGLFATLHSLFRRRRKDVGIRIALGGNPARIALAASRDVALTLAAAVLAGLVVGGFGLRRLQPLLFEVEANDTSVLAAPVLLVVAAAVVAALPAMLRAVRTHPIEVLRED
ncbi:MAG: ABC transporter permease [Acidobacteriota bacterium]